jgi:hypothetical protein
MIMLLGLCSIAEHTNRIYLDILQLFVLFTNWWHLNKKIVKFLLNMIVLMA